MYCSNVIRIPVSLLLVGACSGCATTAAQRPSAGPSRGEMDRPELAGSPGLRMGEGAGRSEHASELEATNVPALGARDLENEIETARMELRRREKIANGIAIAIGIGAGIGTAVILDSVDFRTAQEEAAGRIGGLALAALGGTGLAAVLIEATGLRASRERYRELLRRREVSLAPVSDGKTVGCLVVSSWSF